MATGTTQVNNFVIIVTRAALLLALIAASGANTLRHTLNTEDGGTPDTLPLCRLQVVLAHRTLYTHRLGLIEECSWRTGYTLIVHHNLSRVATETLGKADGVRIKNCSGKRIIHIQSLIFQE